MQLWGAIYALIEGKIVFAVPWVRNPSYASRIRGVFEVNSIRHYVWLVFITEFDRISDTQALYGVECEQCGAC